MKDANGSRRAGRGFTLIELLVVIAIIALLLSLLTPSLQQAKQLAVRVRCQGTEHSIAMALVGYTSEFDGQFPVTAPYWCYSPFDAGPPAWYNGNGTVEVFCEGIGEHLNRDGGELQCAGAIAYHATLHANVGWGIPRTLPTYAVNRTIVPWNPHLEPHGLPYWSECAKRVSKVANTQRTWTFADGDWRGSFSAMDAHNSYLGGQPRFYWEPHMGGVNVVYLDGHAAWVSADQNAHPSDWGPDGPPWADMESAWGPMWK